MSASFKATWLGDGDPQAQLVTLGDLHFVKGQAVTVAADHDFAERIKGNPTFAVDDDKAKPVDAAEPSAEEIVERAEAGTEKGALRSQLRALGVNPGPNASEATMRHKLAEATK